MSRCIDQIENILFSIFSMIYRADSLGFEVDEFYGENEGLTVAEVELSSEDEPFVKPAFIGREVTGDVRYYNSQLMKHPFTTW